jgi:predicted double-glycine peptidase
MIQGQKTAIASMQREIASLSESIHYAGGNCVANCVQWNERQQQKQQQLESMQAQLEQQQKRLEDLQEVARKKGFGSSVYDP